MVLTLARSVERLTTPRPRLATPVSAASMSSLKPGGLAAASLAAFAARLFAAPLVVERFSCGGSFRFSLPPPPALELPAAALPPPLLPLL